MHLFIDTSVRGRIRLAAIPDDSRHPVDERVIEPSRDLVACAEGFFEPHLRRVRGIIVVAGPGSFSSIRSGVLLANLMSRFLNVPLYSVLADVATSKSQIVKSDLRYPASYRELREQIVRGGLRPVPYVAPVYDAEPHITLRPDRYRDGTMNDVTTQHA